MFTRLCIAYFFRCKLASLPFLLRHMDTFETSLERALLHCAGDRKMTGIAYTEL